MRCASAAVVLALGLCAAGSARASWDIFEVGKTSLRVGGYVRALSGVQLAPRDGERAGGDPGTLGIASSIARVEWKLRVGDHVTFELHNRLFFDLRSEAGAAGGLGAGVTVEPSRSLDLSTDLVRTDTFLLEHDIDRAALGLYLGPVDVTLGRQAISWGNSLIFATSDVWAAFSPFDLDTSQKRGIDAVRAITSPSERVELDMVLADRGSLADLSGGVRTTLYLPRADLYLALGKVFDELSVMAGVSAAVGSFKLRAEGHLPYSLDDDALALPRVTVGSDWFGPDVTLTLEAHYNGAGTDQPDRYIAHALGSGPLRRGETYLLGRWYLGGAAAWQATPLVNLSVSVIANLQDPSALVVTRASWDVAQDISLAIGAFNSIGARPPSPPLVLRSELGAAGHLVYLELAAFF
jgi:hypothetical protein